MLREVLTEQVAVPNLQASTKEAVVEALVDVLCATGHVSDRDTALRDVWANERRSSTGMQHGVAIPHARTDAVERMVACVAVTARPVDFQSLDRKPCRIFVMTLSPTGQAGPHLRFLAEIGRLLKERRCRTAILDAQTPAQLLEAFVA